MPGVATHFARVGFSPVVRAVKRKRRGTRMSNVAGNTDRSTSRISGRIVAAARALVGVGVADFAKACGLAESELARLETAGSAWIQDEKHIEAVLLGLDHFGVVLVEECENMGAGVRLKFTRSDVRQIAFLEGEGGVIRSDDAP